MNLDYVGYITLVKAAYQKLRASGQKPHLTNPTRSAIRKECLMLCEERIQKKDEPALRAFFGSPKEGEFFPELIAQFPTEKFKNLQKYMNASTETTEHKNLEILAWLIDFKHRPFKTENDIQLDNEERIALGQIPASNAIVNDVDREEKDDRHVQFQFEKESSFKAGNNNNDNTGAKPTVKGWQSVVKRAAVILGISAVGWAGFSVLNKESACMYWSGDHYEKVDCNERANGRQVIQLDEKELELKKITREDSITEKHIGKLYYIKDDKDIQYFTQKGKYPVDLKRDLQKLSRHIFGKDSINRLLPENNLP